MNLFNEYKKEVIKYAQKLSENGYFGTFEGTGGNVSVRIPEQKNTIIAITPSGRKYSLLSTQDVCLVNLDAEVVEGDLKPSVEVGIHTAVYKYRGDVGAVIHAHQVFSSVFAVINQPIPSLFDEALVNLGEEVELVAYAPSGSKELEQNVLNKLKSNNNCYLLQNHGMLSLGLDLDQAYYRAELLEKCAKVYSYALATGKDITTIPAEAKKHFRQAGNYK